MTNNANSENRAGRAGSADQFGLSSARQCWAVLVHYTVLTSRNPIKQESAKTEHKQARYVEIYLFFSSRQSVNQTQKMAVHELYLSFEARLAPALHTIDDPNHDGHKNGQEKH